MSFAVDLSRWRMFDDQRQTRWCFFYDILNYHCLIFMWFLYVFCVFADTSDMICFLRRRWLLFLQIQAAEQRNQAACNAGRRGIGHSGRWEDLWTPSRWGSQKKFLSCCKYVAYPAWSTFIVIYSLHKYINMKWIYITNWKDPPFWMGKSTISMAMASIVFLYVYQRVTFGGYKPTQGYQWEFHGDQM